MVSLFMYMNTVYHQCLRIHYKPVPLISKGICVNNGKKIEEQQSCVNCSCHLIWQRKYEECLNVLDSGAKYTVLKF